MAIYSADIFTDVPLRKRTRTSIKKVYALKGKIMLESVKHDSDSSELSDDEDMKPPSPSHTVSMTKFPFQTSSPRPSIGFSQMLDLHIQSA